MEKQVEENGRRLTLMKQRLEEQASRLLLNRGALEQGRRQRSNNQSHKLFQVSNNISHVKLYRPYLMNLSTIAYNKKNSNSII